MYYAIIHQKIWGYKVDGKLLLVVCEQEKLNTTETEGDDVTRREPG
jgi:hypothetical protein